MPQFSSRAFAMPASGIRRIFELALLRPDTVMLAVGEPVAEPPAHTLAAAADTWSVADVRYTANAGIAGLRAAIVDKLRRENGLVVDGARVHVTNGGTQALSHAMLLTLGEGDEVLVPDPGYTVFSMAPRMIGAVPVPYRLRAEHGFVPQADDLAALVTPRTRAIVVNSPSNPLGVAYSRDTLQAIVDLAVAHDLWIISDEVYERFVMDAAHVSVAALPGAAERTLTVHSVSKTYALTGARVGWLVTPAGAEVTLAKIQEATTSCVNTPAQHAALAALTGAQDAVDAARELYRERLRASCAVLDERAVPYLPPTGAFYLWIDVSHASGGDVAGWAERFLVEKGVAVAPGSAFGAGGEGWIRICAASPWDDLARGLAALPSPQRPA
ncbi:pyridoxal phosphate-dependent aminotransferase [Microbacterium trichothecenolyticum]|uniref:Aminotransferase n=1 Tax=Microbacterium trichothecenolyticum TaxID=69370 RepID=A0ABU0TR02_MICTR|nr:pyridoxal phosphate-dependent aminotransferase [Microbacterium trichothecenolyticum]MDQ1122097.1 aspartate/methionine/tyrosine aminotransferase [Microbacterium trichothecenolyticum]